VTWLTAERLSVVAPVASRKAASMSRVLSPRANISTARRSNSAVRPASPARTRGTNGAGRVGAAVHAVLDRALRRRQPALAVAVPIPGPRRRAVRVVPAAHRLGHFG